MFAIKALRPGLNSRIGAIRRYSNGSYDGPGKTTMSILNEETNDIMINSYDTSGFRLNNGFRSFGPLIVFPQGVFSWVISGASDINKDSLSLYQVLKPKPDLVIIGYGEIENQKELRNFLALKKDTKLNLEFLPTAKAISTYNFLVSENRAVSAALIPPSYLPNIEDRDIHFMINLDEDNIPKPNVIGDLTGNQT